jgi:glycosyltransferase involved in cell wall biosynthesis
MPMSLPAERAARVGLLATALHGGGGMARFERELLRALGTRSDLEVVLVVPPGEEDAAELAPNVREVMTLRGRGTIGRGLDERYGIGRRLEASGVDVVHGTKHLVPKTRVPTVLTVHDLILLTWTGTFPGPKAMLLPRQYRASLRDATLLAAVSDATRRRLGELEPALLDKTVLVPNGVSMRLLEVVPEALAAARGRSFALVVGDLSARKNLDLLFDLWDEVAAATGLLLVLVGPAGWRSDRTQARLAELQARGVAVWAEDAPDEQLRWCYEHATMLLMPSLEEGFGFPIIEGLAFGVPILASDDAALVEVGRGLVTHLDPRDHEAWRSAIVRMRDAPRATPTPLTDLPTWSDCAAAMVGAYRRAIALGAAEEHR